MKLPLLYYHGHLRYIKFFNHNSSLLFIVPELVITVLNNVLEYKNWGNCSFEREFRYLYYKINHIGLLLQLLKMIIDNLLLSK